MPQWRSIFPHLVEPVSGKVVRADAPLRSLLSGRGYSRIIRVRRSPYPTSTDGLSTEYIDRAFQFLRGDTDGSRYDEAAVEERVCCSVTEKCVSKRAILTRWT
jgi:hypothetical protein